MVPVVEQFNTVAEGWLAIVVAVLWQSTLLAGLVAVVALLLRRASPTVRYWLWQILAIKLLLMPFWSVAVPFPWIPDNDSAPQTLSKAHGWQPVGTDAEAPSIPSLPAPAADLSPVAEQPPSPRWFEQLTWQVWLFAIWLAAILWQTARLFRQRIQLGRLLCAAQQPDDRLMKLVKETADQLGVWSARSASGTATRGASCPQFEVKRIPTVLVTPTDGSPFACGLWRPKLVLPEKLIDTLEEPRLRHVLLHELAHVKRHDLIWGWIPYIARMVWFFHPIAWWAAWKVRLEQELACDQLVMSAAGTDATDYAETLLQVVTHASAPTVLKTAALPSSYLTAGKVPHDAHGWQPVGPNQLQQAVGPNQEQTPPPDDDQTNRKEPEP